MRKLAYLLILLVFTLGGPLGGDGFMLHAEPEIPTAPAVERAGLGLEIEPEAIGDPAVLENLQSPAADMPCYLLVPVGRSEMEEPARLEPIFQAARARGLRVVVRVLDQEWQPIEEWSARLAAFVRATAGTVEAFQIFGPDATRMPAREYAYLLKNARVTIRAAGSGARIVGPPLDAAALAWTEELFSEDAAPYLDVMAVSGLQALESLTALHDRRHARSPIWVTAAADPAAPALSAARSILDGLEAGVEVVFLGSTPSVNGTLTTLRGLFPPGLRPAAPGALPFNAETAKSGGGASPSEPVALHVLPFYDAETRDGLVAYRSEGGPSAVRLGLRAPVEFLELIAPESGAARTLSGPAPAGAVIELPLRAEYLMLRFRLAVTALPLKERAHVGAVSELTAEEIIARERENRGGQEARLSHYEANASIAIHYRVAVLNESIDLTTENRLFVKDGQQDYQQTAMYVNGALWRGKTPPYLPYIQPGTVGEVPLDISLDERYRYQLEGRSTVEGRECYELSFDSTDTTASLYRGRVYIDTHLFTRVKMEAVQTNLSAPLRSNEVVYRYAPVPAPGGDVWLPATIHGQMAFEVLGYNLVVERQATYTGYRALEPGFDERIDEARASDKPLFRETDSGVYRVETKNGEEQLMTLDSPRNTLLLMGMSAGADGGVSFPFAGVNFFDFDFHNTGTQFNLAWAGPFADLSWTVPNLFDWPPERRPWALTLQGSFNGLETEDKNATAEGTSRGERVDVLYERIRAGLAIPMGHFFKWSLEARAQYQNFDTTADTDPAFVLPTSDIEASLAARLEYARLGYLVTAWGESGRRNRWEPWGLPGQKYSDDDRDFTRLGLELRKSYYLTPYQKLSLGIAGYDGRSLDRFSRFELGDFRSARVRGFNGSGIHFDRGAIGEVGYSFPLTHLMRADFSVQEGFVSSEDDFGPGYERVLGSGLGLEFSGPWSTFVTVRMSRALSTTIPDKGGGGDLRVVFYKTFNKWSRKGTGGGKPVQPPIEPDPGSIR